MEIIATLIIACSNLREASHIELNQVKKTCIERVSKCAEESFNGNGLSTPRRQLTCSKEVY